MIRVTKELVELFDADLGRAEEALENITEDQIQTLLDNSGDWTDPIAVSMRIAVYGVWYTSTQL